MSRPCSHRLCFTPQDTPKPEALQPDGYAERTSRRFEKASDANPNALIHVTFTVEGLRRFGLEIDAGPGDVLELMLDYVQASSIEAKP